MWKSDPSFKLQLLGNISTLINVSSDNIVLRLYTTVDWQSTYACILNKLKYRDARALQTEERLMVRTHSRLFTFAIVQVRISIKILKYLMNFSSEIWSKNNWEAQENVGMCLSNSMPSPVSNPIMTLSTDNTQEFDFCVLNDQTSMMYLTGYFSIIEKYQITIPLLCGWSSMKARANELWKQ